MGKLGFLIVTLLSVQSMANWSVVAGARSGGLDSSSLTNSGTTTFSFPTQTGYEFGGAYTYMFNSYFGIRPSALYTNVGFGYSDTVTGFGSGTSTYSGNIFMIPIMLMADLGSHLNIQAGGFYWTTTGNLSCTFTGVNQAGAQCVWGNGGGFGTRAAIGVSFSSMELDLAYEPKFAITTATSSVPQWSLNTFILDFLYHF